MKNCFKLMTAALMALAMFVPAQAEEVTLFQGTNTNEKVPIRGNYVDTEGYIIQTILPEAELTALQGKDITSMKFYVADAGGSSLSGGLMAISVGSTTTTSFPSWSPSAIEGLTHVADFSFTMNETTMVFNFNAPFTYEGGNLVIETKVVNTTDWEDLAFYGVNADINNALVQGIYTSSVEAFYPMVTFTVDGDTPQPQLERGDVNGDTFVNVADVAALINYLLTDASAAPSSADCTLDENVNVADVAALVNYLLTQTW